MTKAKSAEKVTISLTRFSLLKYASVNRPRSGAMERGRVLRQLCSLVHPWGAVKEPEVVKVWEEANEIQNLSAGAVGTFESKESKGW